MLLQLFQTLLKIDIDGALIKFPARPRGYCWENDIKIMFG